MMSLQDNDHKHGSRPVEDAAVVSLLVHQILGNPKVKKKSYHNS